MVGIVEAEHEEALRQGAHQEGFIVAGGSVSGNVALSDGSGLVAKGFPITQNRRNKETTRSNSRIRDMRVSKRILHSQQAISPGSHAPHGLFVERRSYGLSAMLPDSDIRISSLCRQGGRLGA